MLRPPHDESPIVDSLILAVLASLNVPEEKTIKSFENNSGSFEAELEYVKNLLALQNINEHSGDNAYVVQNKKTYRFHCHRADLETPSGIKKPSLKLVISHAFSFTKDEMFENQEKTLPTPQKIEQSRISDPNDHFVWDDLLCMCMSKKKFMHDEVYSAIQATIACVQMKMRTWILKHINSDGGLFFDMGSKLNLADYKINIIEHGGEEVKLITLMNQTVTENLIHYDEVDFLPFPPNVILPKTNFFNLFLGFKAQPATEINFDLINPIIWHVENIWCNGDKILSDPIQGRKLIIMNETGMASGEWHKANDHLKPLITEDYISIEHKGIFPLRVEIGDGRIVALDVSPQCKGNNEYFKQLSKILGHTDTPGSFMSYLLSLDLLDDWNPQHNIPKTKMKMEMMQDQLPNPT
nr:12207_t:CDS:2 [Entrophospora candida]CAG8446747.1 4449_t:CDS:2 [Entrophospora candida]